MIVSLFFPGLGHAAVNFDIIKGYAIMIIYFIMILLVVSLKDASLFGIVPLYHVIAGASAYRG